MNQFTSTRDLDITIAKAIGYQVRAGGLFSPWNTILGAINIEALTPATEAEIWRRFAPRISTDMNQAFKLLEYIHAQYGIQYSLYSEDNWHVCQIGFWNNEAGQSDEIYSARNPVVSIAIAKAIAQCPIVMGQEAIKA